MKRILLLATVVLQLVACAGGGGGGANNPGAPAPPTQGTGGPSTTITYVRTEVPFSTPTLVATVDPLVQVKNNWAVTDMFTADITGSGADIIIAGRETQPATTATWSNSKISMLSWSNNTLVDKTAQWFPNGINEIVGTEPSVKFADFFKTGRTDMLVAPSTDMTLYSPAYLFTNNGSNFSRQSIPLNNVWAHDSAIADVNGDTYKDIVFTDFGPNTTLALNNRVNGFTTYVDSRGASGDLRWGGSGVAVADFLQNGSTQLIMTDNGCNTQNAGCGSSSTKMYTWNINSSNQLNYTFNSDLPAPRFALPKWAGYGFGNGHNVRAVAYDFSDDGVPDALIFSAPGDLSKRSEIQFLKNNGRGTFTDVTDTTLVGYNTNTYTTYNPKFLDLNGDGKTDILVSGGDGSGANNSTQFLLKSSDGKYVAAYQNIMTDFVKQANQLQNADNIGNVVNLFKAPNGKLFLVTGVSFINGSGDRQMAVYMSELGSQTTVSAQTAVNLILQKWPYMSMPQVNASLAMTSATYFGGKVIDLEAALNPIGQIGIPLSNRTIAPIRGYLAGVILDDGSTIATDSLGRAFSTNIKSMNVNTLNSFSYNTEHIDQHNLTSHAEYLVNGSPVTYGNMRIATENRNAFFGNDQGPGMLAKPTQYSIGIPEAYRNGKFSYGMQYTNLNTNPWIAFGGAWGSVTNSGILDNVATYRDGGFSTQASLMHVTTNITPGLITKVNNMVGAWAETGYRYTEDRFGDIGVYAGVKPIVLSGDVEAKMPTSIDNAGNVVYTNKKLAIQNQATPYVRALYTNMIDKKTMYRFSVMGTQQGQYRLMHELRFWID